MKKAILVNIIFLFGFCGFSFANMQNNFFCTITPNIITVTMERENNHKCSEYLKVLSQSVNKEYKNVLEIQKLIQQGYDVEFWTSVREKKRDQIKKMLIIKEQIEIAIKKFDDNLFWKIKEYLIYSAAPYHLKYKRILKSLNNIPSEVYIKPNTKSVISWMQEQVQIIDAIMVSDNYDDLMKNFNRYVYLKKQIEGK